MTLMTPRLKALSLALAGGLSFMSLPAFAETTLKIATDSGAKGSDTGNAIEAWAKKIEEATQGEVKFEIFYQNELGGQQEVFDLLMAGDVDLMLNWPMTSYDQRISILYTPYMFTNWEDGLKAYGQGGWLNEALVKIYDEQGLSFMGAWPEGFNGIGTKGGHATTPEEAAKFKVRVPPVFPFTETVQALGYQTAAIDWGELYSAIQTGIVAGDAANVVFYDLTYFPDLLTDWTYTRTQLVTGALTVNNESLAKLTPEQQDAVRKAAAEVMEERFAAAEAANKADAEKWKALGLTFIEPSEADMKAMVATVREKVWPQMESVIGAELMGLIRENASAN